MGPVGPGEAAGADAAVTVVAAAVAGDEACAAAAVAGDEVRAAAAAAFAAVVVVAVVEVMCFTLGSRTRRVKCLFHRGYALEA